MHTRLRPPSNGFFAKCMVKIAAVVVLLPGLSGCGFLFVNGPPSGHENMNYFSCTESDTGPILDGIWAGLNAGGATLAALDPDAYEDSGQIIAVGAAWTVVSGAAGLVGSNKVEDCREAKQALAERQGAARPPEPATPDTAEIPEETQPDTGQFELPQEQAPVEVQVDTVAADTLVIRYSEYTNPWLNRFDFRQDREECEDAVEDRLRAGPGVSEERFELLVRRCLSGKGWQRITRK